MNKQKLRIIRGKLLKGVENEAQTAFYNTAFDVMERNPAAVLQGSVELMQEGKVQGGGNCFILGIVAGLGLALALDEENN